MLCFRCEWRAKYNDAEAMKPGSGRAPRCECGDIRSSKASCYMFHPCMPIVTTESKAPGDKRLRFGGTLFGTRERAVRLVDAAKDYVVLSVTKLKKGEAFLTWHPLTKEEQRMRRAEQNFKIWEQEEAAKERGEQ